MGVLLKWKKPTSESSYDQVRVYRSDSESGSYSVIQTQTIEDNSYYDMSGSGISWYKIDFYDSLNAIASDTSSALQGNDVIGYCSVDDVRTMTNISTNQVNDTQLATLIEMASGQLNEDINIQIEDERVEYIDEVRENTVDGTNLKYYTKNFPIGDRTNSFSITTSDIEVYTVDSDGLKNTQTVTQITQSTGEFRVNTAIENTDKLYVTYAKINSKQNISVDPVHTMIKMAAIWLTAAFGYSKLNLGKAPRFREGPLTVFRDTKAADKYFTRYYEQISKICSMTGTVEHDDEW